MRSDNKKSVLWCGENIHLFENADENKIPEEIEFDKTVEARKIRCAARDIEFLNQLTVEDMEIAFGAETFDQLNDMVNKKAEEIKICNEIREENKLVPYCAEYKEMARNKQFLPVDEQTRFESQKCGAKKHVTYGNFKKFQRQCYKEYETKIRNGFYTGFMASILCENCESILGCHPSPYKRVYWVSSARCKYCKSEAQTVSFEDLKYLNNLHEAYKQQKYFVNQKHGVKGSINAKLLTTHGQDLSAPFEHAWIKSKMDMD